MTRAKKIALSVVVALVLLLSVGAGSLYLLLDVAIKEPALQLCLEAGNTSEYCLKQ